MRMTRRKTVALNGFFDYCFRSHCEARLEGLALRRLPEPILTVENDVSIRHCAEVKGWVLSDINANIVDKNIKGIEIIARI